MNFIKSIPKFSFYYILPTFMGFTAGLIYRDLRTISYQKALTMSLADYYLDIEEEPNKFISNEFPDLKDCMERGSKRIKK